ncbi:MULTISPECIES: DUF3168 domain-containing protein [unclassified Mesorhizobium]|uniref:DUF3168 domain-containing protein n=1 Tax=unclassified Mesorhizobium TaxID=325217 RepID=UPI001127E43C|nr:MULTISPECIES: DUF3168 domain-containing protein [unclassified Mesorhizobium]TPJ86956.1 DUF3168 domain-containing protein [Mesorhizobium sp. B2-5-12]TPK19179.1 DUF3168 domain-containing protein [Mesorhizobium sp. B2-5-6]
MAAPMHEMIGVATARLKAYAGLTALVPATNIFYRPPASYVPPYVTLDDAFSVRDDMSCVDSIEITLNVHVWTDDSHPLAGGGGALQDARAIGWQVVKALHHYDLVLPNNRLVTLANTGERYFYDQDGVTGHGVVSMSSVIEAT